MAFRARFLAGRFQVIAKANKLIQFTQLFQQFKTFSGEGSIGNGGVLNQTGSEKHKNKSRLFHLPEKNRPRIDPL